MPGYRKPWRTNTRAVNPVLPGNMICRRKGCGAAWKTILACVPARDYKEEQNERKRTFLLITIPILALFVCFNTIPLIRGVIYSFTNFKGFGSYDWVGFRNYVDLFSDARVGKSYLFTFKLAIVPTVVVNVISLIMALVGLLCALLLKDFRQFTLAYLVIAIFAATPVFLSANTSVKFDWIGWHPFYHVYIGLKNAYFGTAISPIYYAGAAAAIALLFLAVLLSFRREIGKEG